MDIRLNEIEARVLGSLIEKEITTPDYYPLSVNALVNACNQKNNRDPIMNLDQQSVGEAVAGLQSQRLAGPARGADSRVSKYEHRIQEVFNLTRGETAILCLLLLRGPQTLGELRGRTERMFHFQDLDEVQSTLQRMVGRDPALAKMLPRQPGTKESRYAHLLAGELENWSAPVEMQPPTRSGGSSHDDRIARLEEQVGELKQEMAEIKLQFAGFRKQFE